MNEESCVNCRFWQRDGGDGICRRTGPVAKTGLAQEKYTVFWPRTRVEDWCGMREAPQAFEDDTVDVSEYT